MENIRSVIKERIKSCISCNVEQCPVIKQRLDQHVLSHHSTAYASHSCSNQKVHQKQSKPQMPSESKISIVKLDDSTSTTDYILDKNKTDDIINKQHLKDVVFKWFNDIPNKTEEPENIKQNKLNEFIEKINNLCTDINNKFYESKLKKEIDDFLNSIVGQATDEVKMRTLKDKLIAEIQEIYKKLNNNKNESTKLESVDDEIGTKEIAVNTLKSDFEQIVEGPSAKYVDTGTQNSLNDSSIRDNTTITPSKTTPKVYVDSEVQHNFSNVFSLHTSINKNPLLQKRYGQETEKDKEHKQSIFNWFCKLNKQDYLNIDQDDIYHEITVDLFNRLKPILDLKSYAIDKNSLLKDEIFHFILKNLNLSLNPNNIVNLKELTNALAINLLNGKYQSAQNEHPRKPIHKIIGSHHNINFDVLRKINDVVVNALVNNGIYSDRLINNMTECIIEDVNSASVYQDKNLNIKLCNFLKHSTGLPEIDIANIINDITEKISHLNYISNLTESLNDSWHNNVISVYKSEVDLTGQSNNTSITRRKSSVTRNKTNGKLKTEETNYANKISAEIATWLDTLPVGARKSKTKKNKQSFVQNLTNDILDQVKLHLLIEENTEKDRYISFFIYRWLNKFEFFENINEAKPFVDQLLQKIASIPEPTRSEVDNKQKKDNTNEELIKLKNEIINIINDLSPKYIMIKDEGKRNKIIDDLILQVQSSVTERQSLNEISNVIDKSINQMLNSDQKQIIAKVRKDIIDMIQNMLQNSNLDKINNKTEASETILKNYITKYLDHRFDPEDSIARAAFTQLLKNELNSLGTPQSHKTNNSTLNYEQEEFLIDKLSKELEYINIIIDWLKSLPLEESFNTIDNNIFARSINKLAKDINEIEENFLESPPGVDRNEQFASKIEIFLEQIPISQQYRQHVDRMIEDLISQITYFNMSQGTCCQMPECQPASSVGRRSETDHDISNFIEEYIRNNSDEISQDDLKLEACILRFFDEIDQKEAESVGLSKSQLNNENNKKDNLQNNEGARRFSFELGYANEISQWLKNLPLKPLKDEQSRTQIGNMVSSLAEKVCQERMENSNNQIDSDLADYINNWITALPLDSSKNVNLPVAVQQLLNRLERVDVEKFLSDSNKEKHAMNNLLMISQANACCGNPQDIYPGSTIINEIEAWCNTLPIQSENENDSDVLKQNVATKLYQKIRELNINSEYFSDDLLYRELLNREIEELLNELPQNSKLQSLKDVLKKQLVDVIMEKRNEIKEKSSAVEYRHDLEKTIDISMPHPVAEYSKESPGYKIYKDRLAAIFILQNFDHGNDASKLNYEKRLKMEIDKYFKDVQQRNSVPLSKDQIYNELYSALFSVPLPNGNSIIEEVEEIKTRCEIDDWFENLPLKEAAGVGELLEWDQILAMLAKRLHEMEKNECGSESKMHNEITKWLLRLPLLPGQENNIDDFAHDLKRKLKMTQQNRQCLSRHVNASDESKLNKNNENRDNSTNIKADKWNNKNTSTTPLTHTLPSCCQTTPSSQDSQNPVDAIIKIVEAWCQSLPLRERDNTKVMKEHIAVKIIMKISEINMNPEIFEDDFLYKGILEDELDNQLAKIPKNVDFNKQTAKNQLINAIETVKPLIKEEKLRYEYKHEVKNTIDNILNAPQGNNSKTTAELVSLRDEIADDFIVYEFHNQSNESSLIKDKIYQNIESFLKLSNGSEKTSCKPLIMTNQLICELRKISVPSEFVIIEELKEIDIKFEIEKFFDKISLPQDADKLSSKNQVKSTLAKRLSDFEKQGYTPETCFKMRKEVVKYVKKIDDKVDTHKVDEFIDTLQKTYSKRMSISQPLSEVNSIDNENKIQGQPANVREANYSSPSINSKQRRSLLPPTRKRQNTQEDDKDIGHTLNDTSTSYKTFGSGVKASSSMRKSIDQSKGRPEIDNGRYLYNTDQNIPHPYSSYTKSPYSSNISQREVSGISGTSNSKRIQDLNNQNRTIESSTEYQPTLYPGDNQHYTSQPETQEKYTNTSRLFENEIQPNKFSQHNQFQQSSNKQLPAMEPDSNKENTRNACCMSPDDMTIDQNRQAAQQSPREMSISSQDFENINSCCTPYSIARNTYKRPAITIFSPSYLEPEINESQETIEKRKCKSKTCSKQEKIECRCEKENEEKIICKCEKKDEEKVLCKCERIDDAKKDDEKILCKCGKKQSRKSNWLFNSRKYCKFCNRIHPFDCGMYNYPNCYY